MLIICTATNVVKCCQSRILGLEAWSQSRGQFVVASVFVSSSLVSASLSLVAASSWVRPRPAKAFLRQACQQIGHYKCTASEDSATTTALSVIHQYLEAINNTGAAEAGEQRDTSMHCYIRPLFSEVLCVPVSLAPVQCFSQSDLTVDWTKPKWLTVCWELEKPLNVPEM